MITVAAEAIATSADEPIQPQNPIHRLSLEGQQHEPSFVWNREEALCESRFYSNEIIMYLMQIKSGKKDPDYYVYD